MLVHICCSVDSHYFLQKIQKDYPDENIIAFFYDPNIHPYSEYKLRLLDVEYSCKLLNIPLIEGEYDIQTWFNKIKGFENEPEKGLRCNICFERRLEVTAQEAKKLKQHTFTTTLLMSPKKSQEKLKLIGNQLAKQYNLQFLFKDYRIGKGMQEQSQEVKKYNIYRQDYCGCMFALKAQRNMQNRLSDELFSPVNQQILPESIEERIELYKNRKPTDILIKQRFLNYRLFSAKILIKQQVIPSYFLCYSTLKNNKSNGKIEKIIDNIGYFVRDEIKFITLDYFNKLSNKNYKTILELAFNPLTFEDELQIRYKIVDNCYDLSTIIVVDHFSTDKYTIFCNSQIYEDVKTIVKK